MINYEKLTLKIQLHALSSTLHKWNILRSQDIHIDLYALEDTLPTCACCSIYRISEGNCANCPIAIHANKDFCSGTPYVDWVKNKFSATNYISPKDIAQREYEFLKEIETKVLNKYRSLDD